MSLAYIPWFGWLGIASILGFYVSAAIIFIARKKRKPKLRKYHYFLAGTSLLGATIHGVYALTYYF